MAEKTHYLSSLLHNDSQGIMEIYELVYPKVRRFLVQNKGSEQDAEDIFQKALLQIAVRYRRDPFEISSSFEAYLFTACKILWRRELNKSKNRVTNDGTVELVSDELDLSLSILEQKRWEVFQRNLNVISENCRKILRLFFNKTPYSEIILTMGYSSETVARQRVFKCKAKLSKAIKADEDYNALKTL